MSSRVCTIIDKLARRPPHPMSLDPGKRLFNHGQTTPQSCPNAPLILARRPLNLDPTPLDPGRTPLDAGQPPLGPGKRPLDHGQATPQSWPNVPRSWPNTPRSWQNAPRSWPNAPRLDPGQSTPRSFDPVYPRNLDSPPSRACLSIVNRSLFACLSPSGDRCLAIE